MPQTDGESKTIDGHTYTVYMLPPRTAMRLLLRMAKMLGPSLGPVVDSLAGDYAKGGLKAVLDMNLGEKFFADLAAGLFERLDESIVDNVMDELITVTHVGQVGSDKIPTLDRVFDVHFRGRLGSMSKWMAFALKVQYGNFWSALQGIAPPGSAEDPPSLSPLTSTG